MRSKDEPEYFMLSPLNVPVKVVTKAEYNKRRITLKKEREVRLKEKRDTKALWAETCCFWDYIKSIKDIVSLDRPSGQ
jgi:hypothetical protein